MFPYTEMVEKNKSQAASNGKNIIGLQFDIQQFNQSSRETIYYQQECGVTQDSYPEEEWRRGEETPECLSLLSLSLCLGPPMILLYRQDTVWIESQKSTPTPTSALLLFLSLSLDSWTTST